MLINHATRQVTAKIVYYGAGLCGKTTNLFHIHAVTNPASRGELVSMETEIERTLFFDLLPMNVGLVKGYQTKFQLYTVPGQVFYDSTRKLVLKGADGIVFVVDSQELMEETNLESFQNLNDHLDFYGVNLAQIPLVFQYNKRDLKNIVPIERMNKMLNESNRPHFAAVATKGSGVIETLREIAALTLAKVKETLEHEKNKQEKVAVRFAIEKLPTVSSIKEDQTEPEKIPAKESPPVAAKAKPTSPPAPESLLKTDFLKEFEDPSRVTIIERLNVNGGGLQIDIHDGDGQFLKTFRIAVSDKTKKINLIFDVRS